MDLSELKAGREGGRAVRPDTGLDGGLSALVPLDMWTSFDFASWAEKETPLVFLGDLSESERSSSSAANDTFDGLDDDPDASADDVSPLVGGRARLLPWKSCQSLEGNEAIDNSPWEL